MAPEKNYSMYPNKSAKLETRKKWKDLEQDYGYPLGRKLRYHLHYF